MSEVYSSPVVSDVITQQATVFLKGAELEQYASFNLQKGENEVRLEGLAPSIDEQSLQLSLTNGAVITAFRFSLDYMRQMETNSAIQQLQEQLAAVEKQCSEVQNAIDINTGLSDMLGKGVSNALQSSEHPLQSDAIEKQLAYYQQRSEQLMLEKYSLEKQLNELTEKKSAIQSQLNQEGKNKKRAGVVTMTVQSPVTGKVKARIKYFTSAARWIPYYDMLVPEIGQPVTLTLKGKVMQNTGVNWQQVKLVLSTYSPSKSNEVPEFSSWRLRKQEATGSKMNRSRFPMEVESAVMEKRSLMKTDAVMEEVEEEVYDDNAMVQYVEAEEQTLMAVYNISIPYNVEGNGKEQIVVLQEQKIENVEYKYQALPKLDDEVYLTAQINDWQKLSLLSGDVNLTYGSTYLGKTNINTSSTKNTLLLTLTTDPQITVKRELQKENSSTTTFGSNNIREFTYLLTVRNNKKQPVKLTLKEQYPVSAAKDIQVELLDTTSKYTENDKEKGVLGYDLDLQAGETKVIQVGYTVKYPKDWKINL